MIDRSPLRLERSSESLTLGVDAKRRPEGSRHGEGQAFAPEFRQRGAPRERTWECARTHQGRATGRGGNYGGPGPCRAFALLQERARAPPPPTLAHGTRTGSEAPRGECFRFACRKQHSRKGRVRTSPRPQNRRSNSGCRQRMPLGPRCLRARPAQAERAGSTQPIAAGATVRKRGCPRGGAVRARAGAALERGRLGTTSCCGGARSRWWGGFGRPQRRLSRSR
jgi:hypothetical protein